MLVCITIVCKGKSFVVRDVWMQPGFSGFQLYASTSWMKKLAYVLVLLWMSVLNNIGDMMYVVIVIPGSRGCIFCSLAVISMAQQLE